MSSYLFEILVGYIHARHCGCQVICLRYLLATCMLDTVDVKLFV